jgi:hypothetical protein
VDELDGDERDEFFHRSGDAFLCAAVLPAEVSALGHRP